MVHELNEWQQHLVYGDGDIYQRMTEAFRMKHGMGGSIDEIENQYNVILEEIEEFEEVMDNLIEDRKHGGLFEGEYELAEEMADTIYTIHLMANMLNINLNKVFKEKASYNLQKSTERDESGKVTDDVGGSDGS